jgi:steroid delta-isomerase-like uncharacterized protein
MMTPEQNNELARRFFDSAWNKGDYAAMDELTASDAIDHSPIPGESSGPEKFKEIVSMFRSALPDIHLTIEDEIYTDDKVVHRWTLRGTHENPLMGVPATGNPITFTGTTIIRFADGKIAERWANLDELGLLKQLGVIPAS